MNTVFFKMDVFNQGYLRRFHYFGYALLIYTAFAPGCGSDNGSVQQLEGGTATNTLTTGGVGGSTTTASGSGGGAAATTSTTGTGGAKQAGSGGSSGALVAGAGGKAGGQAGGSAGTGGTKADAGTSTGAEPEPSPGCSGGKVKPGNTTETMQSGGRSHQYVQHVPSSYDGKIPFSLLIDLHGGTYDGARWDTRNGKGNPFKELAETEHFILLSPTSTDTFMGMWSAETSDSVDGVLIRDLIDVVEKNACIDTRRIYATGCSMGGAMSFWLACYASDVIAAVVPMCGTAFFELATECKPTRPVSMMFIMGALDEMNCWEPPRPPNPGNPCASEVLEAFKNVNGCTDEWEETHTGLCRTHDKCKENTEATICLLNTNHMGIYEATDMNVYIEGWNFLKRFYIH